MLHPDSLPIHRIDVLDQQMRAFADARILPRHNTIGAEFAVEIDEEVRIHGKSFAIDPRHVSEVEVHDAMEYAADDIRSVAPLAQHLSGQCLERCVEGNLGIDCGRIDFAIAQGLNIFCHHVEGKEQLQNLVPIIYAEKPDLAVVHPNHTHKTKSAAQTAENGTQACGLRIVPSIEKANVTREQSNDAEKTVEEGPEREELSAELQFDTKAAEANVALDHALIG